MEQTAIANAIDAAEMAADALSAQSSTEDVAAAEALAAAAREEVTGAVHASAADTAASLAAIDAIDAAIATASDLVDARIADEVETANRATMQMNAIRMAAAAVDTSSLTTQAAIDTAQLAIDALQAAIDAADDVDDTSMYQSQVDTAQMTVNTAQTSLDTMGRMDTQRAALTNAVSMARTAVAGVNDDSTDSEVAAADSALATLRQAIADAVDLAGDADVASAQGTLATLTPQLEAAKRSRTAAIEAADKAMREAMAATGKALHAALAGPDPTADDALDNLESVPAFTTAGGLSVDAAAGAGTLADGAAHAAVELDAGDSVGSLGSWMGMDYAHSAGTGDSKVTNDARVYTNQGTATTQPFSGTDGKYTLIAVEGATMGYVLLGEAATPIIRARADAFTHSGTQNHPVPNQRDAVYFRGTYDGAPGQFRCAADCASTNDGSGAPSALGGTWHFKPDAGAMVSVPDEHYLYYGWWVSKDSDGGPTAASAFAGRAGTEPGDDTDGLDTAGNLTAITGSATYAGHAAGKFAMTNVLTGTGNGGHFTADATLNAKFSGTEPGVSGTIDNFRLNDGSEDPGWSVSLALGALGSSGGSITAPVASDSGPTVWTINGNAAEPSGTWSGTMYDEAVGDGDDGSNLPTTVTGTFYSEFSTIGRMVGAFGAELEQ